MRVRLTFAAAPVVLVAGILGGCTPAGPGIDRIDAVDFRQTQAVPDFDDSDYTQDDPAEIARFVELLREHGVDPTSWRHAETDGCTGNRVTTLTIRYADSDLATPFSVDSCVPDAFDQEADELFSEWRVALGG
jgi:hypothetical protein